MDIQLSNLLLIDYHITFLYTDRITGDDYQNDLDALNIKNKITEGQSGESIHESVKIHETTEKNENGFHATRE